MVVRRYKRSYLLNKDIPAIFTLLTAHQTNDCVCHSGLQWIQAELVIAGSGAGSYCHAHDREGCQGWYLGGAAELSLSNIVDADTRESL